MQRSCIWISILKFYWGNDLWIESRFLFFFFFKHCHDHCHCHFIFSWNNKYTTLFLFKSRQDTVTNTKNHFFPLSVILWCEIFCFFSTKPTLSPAAYCIGRDAKFSGQKKRETKINFSAFFPQIALRL